MMGARYLHTIAGILTQDNLKPQDKVFSTLRGVVLVDKRSRKKSKITGEEGRLADEKVDGK